MTRTTHRLDAAGVPLGRLSTQIATLLRGKHKPTFIHHLDQGDAVVVVNAAKVKLTGRKLDQKVYHHHTGYIGHLKTETAKDLMATRPEQLIIRAVTGMLPRNRLRAGWLKRLAVYAATEPAAPTSEVRRGHLRSALSERSVSKNSSEVKEEQ